ncbi:MAG: SIS domain-containing protein [Alphaproteobacteria bacterium]
MAAELREAPDAVRRQADLIAAPLAELVARLQFWPPSIVVTCARGSSAHAATFAKHLIELHLGIPVAAAAPNISSVYHRPLRLDGQLFLAVSQSGRSDDLVANAAMARDRGALTAALVNDTDSPLAAACDIVLPIGAGPERGVAATKTFVASLAALLLLVAEWAEDLPLAVALAALPERLASAGDLDWDAAIDPIAAASSLVVIGRGPTLAIAREAALKLQEVANRPAEAFSGAEFLHGPVALVAARYPIIALMPGDAADAGMRALVHRLAGMGAAVLAAAPDGELPVLPPDHPETDAVCLIQSFYAMLYRLAARLGIDPDRPRHLQKVTRTR